MQSYGFLISSAFTNKFCDSQKDNVSNQREHIVLLLANEQSRLGIPDENEPVSLIYLVICFIFSY